jgi:hypothetical protein
MNAASAKLVEEVFFYNGKIVSTFDQISITEEGILPHSNVKLIDQKIRR